MDVYSWMNLAIVSLIALTTIALWQSLAIVINARKAEARRAERERAFLRNWHGNETQNRG